MANPLTLLMPIVPGTDPATILQALSASQGAIDAAMTGIGTVHFARFMILDASVANLQPNRNSASTDTYVLAVITEYDGDFDAYISDFANQIGDVFNALLRFVVGGPELIPVAQHLNAFTAFVQENDASQNPLQPAMYSAYPNTVQQILASNG